MIEVRCFEKVVDVSNQIFLPARIFINSCHNQWMKNIKYNYKLIQQIFIKTVFPKLN